MPGVTVVGLGPGDPALVTRAAWQVLGQAPEVYLRTGHLPLRDELSRRAKVFTFDSIYEQAASFEQVYEQVIARLVALARREEGVVYAVPGDPSVGEATVAQLRRWAAEERISFRLIPGVSFIEPALALVEIDALDGVFVGDAIELAARHVPPFPPDRAALLGQLHSRLLSSDVKLTLLSRYPPEHTVALIRAAGTSRGEVHWLPLEQIDQGEDPDPMTALFVPPLARLASLEAFEEVVARLRAPDGCPWDREQTHRSLRRHLLQEAYEALAALDQEDAGALREELGDLLLQIVLQAQIASEGEEFRLSDVLGDIREKIVRRHPHVFGDVKVSSTEEVLHRWEELKESERPSDSDESGLEGIPSGLPALAQALEMQDRAARVGFDWPSWEGVLAKLQEEVVEVRSASGDEDREREAGDLLFTVVNVLRWLKIDSEAALRAANERFRRRYGQMGRLARAGGKRLRQLAADELDELWRRTKAAEGSGSEG